MAPPDRVLAPHRPPSAVESEGVARGLLRLDPTDPLYQPSADGMVVSTAVASFTQLRTEEWAVNREKVGAAIPWGVLPI
jgi:hypothetical protein